MHNPGIVCFLSVLFYFGNASGQEGSSRTVDPPARAADDTPAHDAASPSKKKDRFSVAVLPIRAKGQADTSVLEVLDDLLLVALQNAAAGKLEVIGKSDIEALLRFESTKDALGCDDVRCAAEIAGALGVETIVTAAVGTLGSRYVLTLAWIDQDAAAPLRRHSESLGSQVDAFDQGVRAAARALFANLDEHGLPKAVATTAAETGSANASSPSSSSAAPPASSPHPQSASTASSAASSSVPFAPGQSHERRPGAIVVRTDPPGAEIRLDGRPMKTTTPQLFSGLSPGAHRVEARLGGRAGKREVVLSPGETLQVEVPLDTEVKAGLRVSSRPTGAIVLINGEEAGTTPLVLDGLSPGPAIVSVELDDHLPKSIETTLEQDEVRDLQVTMTPAAHYPPQRFGASFMAGVARRDGALDVRFPELEVWLRVWRFLRVNAGIGFEGVYFSGPDEFPYEGSAQVLAGGMGSIGIQVEIPLTGADSVEQAARWQYPWTLVLGGALGYEAGSYTGRNDNFPAELNGGSHIVRRYTATLQRRLLYGQFALFVRYFAEAADEQWIDYINVSGETREVYETKTIGDGTRHGLHIGFGF